MAGNGAHDESETTDGNAAGEVDQFDGSEYLDRFTTLIERGKTVLDVGCGDGLPVDAYLIGQGFAVNGIDASPRLIERTRKNVPDGFYEVRDVLDLRSGEYCVDGIVSLRAMLDVPGQRYGALLKDFASFMPNGGAILLAMREEALEDTGEDARGHDPVDDNGELLEAAGFTIIVDRVDGRGDAKRYIVLARS